MRCRDTNGLQNVLYGSLITLCSLTFAATPTEKVLKLGLIDRTDLSVLQAPYFFADLDASGYSDWIYWGPSPRHNDAFLYHEVLSGEWGSAVYYDEIATELLDPSSPSLGREAMWLTDKFLFPNWFTNSNFIVTEDPSSWNSENNPTPEHDTARAIIANQKIEITVDFEVVDLGSSVDDGVGGSPLAFFVPDPNNPESVEHYFVESDRYLFLQTYTFRNIDPNETLTNLEFYQMLHSHANDNYGDTVSIAYDDSDFWPDPLEDYIPYDPNHKSGNFRFDMTSWSASDPYGESSHADVDEVDWVGFSCTVEPNWVECGFYRGGHNYNENNKPAKPGTHWNIEDRDLSGDIYQYDEVAGAMGWHLGSLDPNETTSITVAFMFGTGPIKTMADLYVPLDLEITDDVSTCVSPCPSDKTLTIDYSYLWNIPGWEAYSFSPSDVKELKLTCYLPPEADFDFADPNEGYYDSDLHAYVWYIGDLTGGEDDSVDISVYINSLVIPGVKITSSVVAEYTVSGIKYSQQTEHSTPVCECDCGSIIYVDQDATAGGDNGTSWGNAYLKFQDALAEADVCDRIWVSKGTYTPADEPDEFATFNLPNGVRFYGGFDGSDERDWLNNETILSGYIDPNNVNYVVTTDATVGWAILDGFTIEGGLLAGILCQGDSVYIEHNQITDNGIGILCDGTQSPIIRNNWIYDNGTGIYMENPQSAGVILNNTIVYNGTVGVLVESGAKPLISSCIFWGCGDPNDMTGCYATYSCIEYPNHFWDYSDPNNPIDLGIGLGNITGDPNNPLFVDAGDNNYHLDPNSRCIDTGRPNFVYTGNERDIDKHFRLLYGRVDMGADEYCDECDTSDADFTGDDIVNMLDYDEFAAAWLRDSSDPNWGDKYFEYDLLGDGDAVDVNDLCVFAEDWLWMGCDAMKEMPIKESMAMETYYEMSKMGGFMEAGVLSSAVLEPEPLSIEEQIAHAKDVVDWLEKIWEEDEEVSKTIDEDGWDEFMKKIYEWLNELETSPDI